MVGGEGTSQGAAGDRVHHRCFDFEKPTVDQKIADDRQHPGAYLEHAPRGRVHDQIQVALAVSCLDIGEAMPLLRQRQETLREKLKAPGPDRQFVGPGTKQPPFDPDVIPDVEPGGDREVPFGQCVFPHIDLHAGDTVGNHQEPRLAKAPNDQNPTRDRGVILRRVQIVATRVSVRRDDGGHGVGAAERLRIR